MIGSRFIPQKNVKKSTLVKIEPNHFEDGAASLCFLQFLDYVTSKLLHPLREKCPNTELFLVRTWTLFRMYSLQILLICEKNVVKIYLMEHFMSLEHTGSRLNYIYNLQLVCTVMDAWQLLLLIWHFVWVIRLQ